MIHSVTNRLPVEEDKILPVPLTLSTTILIALTTSPTPLDMDIGEYPGTPRSREIALTSQIKYQNVAHESKHTRLVGRGGDNNSSYRIDNFQEPEYGLQPLIVLIHAHTYQGNSYHVSTSV